jgi:hypothetical protein
MTEENEDRPFISLSFNEEGEFDRYAGIYLHVPLSGEHPAPEEIAALIGTVKSAIKVWKELSGKLGLIEVAHDADTASAPWEGQRPVGPEQRMVVPSYEEADEAERLAKGEGRPPGGSTDAQCKAILAICHRLGDDVVTPLLSNYGGAEWKLDKEGHCIPNWDFLKSLSKQQASSIIERLGRAAS